MKRNYLLLLLTAFVFSFASCSNDDDEDVKAFNMNDLKGEWEMTAYTTNGQSEFSEGDNSIWSFEDGNFEAYVEGDLQANGTYEMQGNKLTISPIGEEKDIFTIDDLNKTTLKLSIKEIAGGVTSDVKIAFRKK